MMWQTWEYDRIDGAQVENETDCFELEPIYELKVGTGVQLLSVVRPPSSAESTVWFAQVPHAHRLSVCTELHSTRWPSSSSVQQSVAWKQQQLELWI